MLHKYAFNYDYYTTVVDCSLPFVDMGDFLAYDNVWRLLGVKSLLSIKRVNVQKLEMYGITLDSSQVK